MLRTGKRRLLRISGHYPVPFCEFIAENHIELMVPSHDYIFGGSCDLIMNILLLVSLLNRAYSCNCGAAGGLGFRA